MPEQRVAKTREWTLRRLASRFHLAATSAYPRRASYASAVHGGLDDTLFARLTSRMDDVLMFMVTLSTTSVERYFAKGLIDRLYTRTTHDCRRWISKLKKALRDMIWSRSQKAVASSEAIRYAAVKTFFSSLLSTSVS
jgi:hypothetical protein